MKLQNDPRLPQSDDVPLLKRRLFDLFRDSANQVNSVSEGKIAGAYNAVTSIPQTGSFTQGDFVRNSAPAEQGTAGSKYVVFGWLCTVSGTPGTFVQMRFLTGN